MEVAIISCARKEELYIKEWIDWNLSLGVDHIFIADNNDPGYEKPLDRVIQEYIDKSKVTVLDYNDISPIQPKCYQDIYEKYGYDYDWFYICDIDEFLHIPETEDNIKEFINLPRFNGFDSISINWRSYDDNDLVYYDPRPVQERFTRLANTKIVKNGERDIVKSIFRSKKYNPEFKINHHHDPLDNNIKVIRCNVLGIRRAKNTCDKGNYDEKYRCAYIAHYELKTLEEYHNKILRGRCSSWKNGEYRLHRFWDLNNKTPEKLEYYGKFRLR